jgi:hypothetical protein
MYRGKNDSGMPDLSTVKVSRQWDRVKWKSVENGKGKINSMNEKSEWMKAIWRGCAESRLWSHWDAEVVR